MCIKYPIWTLTHRQHTHTWWLLIEQSKQIHPIRRPITSSLTVAPFIALTIEQHALSHMNRDLVTWWYARLNKDPRLVPHAIQCDTSNSQVLRRGLGECPGHMEMKESIDLKCLFFQGKCTKSLSISISHHCKYVSPFQIKKNYCKLYRQMIQRETEST